MPFDFFVIGFNKVWSEVGTVGVSSREDRRYDRTDIRMVCDHLIGEVE